MIRQIIYIFHSEKLKKYNGFKKEHFDAWMKQSGIGFFTKLKLLRFLRIISSQEIRKEFRKYVEEKSNLLQNFDYILSFGQAGKSGDILLYELRHSKLLNSNKFIRLDEITTISQGSKILFVDDLVGTGKQSTDYINNRLTCIIPKGVDFYLLTLFATERGIEHLKQNTNITDVIPLSIIDESESIFDDKNKIFGKMQKERLMQMNSRLASKTSNFDFNFLLCFYYAIPNNSIQLLWKHGHKYIDKDVPKVWNALLPRDF